MAAVALACCAGASAAAMVLDFDGAPQGEFFHSITVDNWLLSPNCHLHIAPTPPDTQMGFGGSQWLGFDRSGCLAPGYQNADWAGPAEFAEPVGQSAVFMDFLGGDFSLQSMFFNAPGITVRSSAGAEFTSFLSGPGSIPASFAFSGPGWDHLDWLLLYANDLGAPLGIDQVVFDTRAVPEPASALLCGLGLLVAWAARRPAAKRRAR
jgi:hypothetical protein